MTEDQYNKILAELLAAVVLNKDYKDIASLVLQGTCRTMDTWVVLRQLEVLAVEVANEMDDTWRNRNEPLPAASEYYCDMLKLFNRGLLNFIGVFRGKDPELYALLGFHGYFTTARVQQLRESL